MSRWYDKNKKLSFYIDSFSKLDSDSLRKIVDGALILLRKKAPVILQHFQIPADIERWSKRWYDLDPHLWLFLNSLKKAKPKLIKEIITYLEKQLKHHKRVSPQWKKKKKLKK